MENTTNTDPVNTSGTIASVYTEPTMAVAPDRVNYDSENQKKSSLSTTAAKTGGNIFMMILKVIFGGIKTFFRFFFALGFMAKMLFLLILIFFMGVSFFVGYFAGKNNYDEKIKKELEQAQIKLENIEKEIRQ